MRLLRFLAFVVGLALAGPAFAHAVLVYANPAEGAALANAPQIIQLRFNEPVQALVLRVIDAQGKTHDLTPTSQGEEIAADLPKDLPPGTQVLSYRVVSLDGHPVGASVSFSIGRTQSASAPAKQSPAVAIALWATRALDLTLLLGGAGMAFFFAFLAQARPSPRFGRASNGALGVGMALAAISVGLQGLDLLGLPLASLADLAPWRAALGTSFAATALFELVAFAMAALAMRQKIASKALGLLVLGCIGCARAASGHAALADPIWLMRPAIFLHAGAAAVWAGALAPLIWLATTNAEAFKIALRRFSAIAVTTVAVLLLLGCVIAGVQMREPAALLDTDYGRLLSLKLGLVSALLLLALWNRRVGTPLVLGKASGAISRIGRSIAAEIALLICIFAVVAGWRFTPPPRALIEARGMERLELANGHMRAVVRIEPGRAGENRWAAALPPHSDGFSLPGSRTPPARHRQPRPRVHVVTPHRPRLP